MPAPQWLIEGMFERTSLVMLAGPSYSFKSFLLLDWLLSMASGRKWNARPTQVCKIVYVLGEGKSSLIKRIQAWIIHNKLSPVERERLEANFRVSFEVPQLASKASTDNFLADLSVSGFVPEVIAIDTFARSMVGLDENDAKDTGMWIDSADRLRQLGYGVIFLHHTKKNTEFGVTYRGSSAIIGAMDTAMTLVRRDNTCTLTITKQKDHDEGPDLKFNKLNVAIGTVDKSCVLVFQPDEMKIEGVDVGFVPTPMSSKEIWEMADKLIKTQSFVNDAERAETLAMESGLSKETCQSRISQARKRLTE